MLAGQSTESLGLFFIKRKTLAIHDKVKERLSLGYR